MRKLHFSVWDSSEFHTRVKKSERYSILIVYGELQFKFSNKQKAERFIHQYERLIIDSFQFYGLQVPKLTESYYLLLPQLSYFSTREVRESLRFSIDIVDKVFCSFSHYNATAIVYWSIMMCDELLKATDILLKGAKKSRYNQSELIKLRQVKYVLKSYQDTFFDQYKNYRYKGSTLDSGCKVIQLYDKLQYALNL